MAGTRTPVYVHKIGHGHTILSFLPPKDLPPAFIAKQGDIVSPQVGTGVGSNGLFYWLRDGSGEVRPFYCYNAVELAVTGQFGLTWEPAVESGTCE